MSSKDASLAHFPTEKPAATRIVLTGFMGSGKSTVGQMLATSLGWIFLDLDDAIEKRAGISVPQIFSDQGEAAFRQLEAHELAAALRQQETVIALGGGALETDTNRLLLQDSPSTSIVYLSAPFAALRDRCEKQATRVGQRVRPNFATITGAEGRFTAREPIYRSLAHIVVDSTLQSPHETLQTILRSIDTVTLSQPPVPQPA